MYPSNIDEYFKLSAFVPQEWLTLIFHLPTNVAIIGGAKKLGEIELFHFEPNKQISVVGNIFYFSLLCEKYNITQKKGSLGLPTVVINNFLTEYSDTKVFSATGDFVGVMAYFQYLSTISYIPKNIMYLCIGDNALTNIDFIDLCENIILLSIEGCGLKTADVDRILKAFVDFDKILDLEMLPEICINRNEPPSVAGLLNIAILKGKGWTVTYDLPLN